MSVHTRLSVSICPERDGAFFFPFSSLRVPRTTRSARFFLFLSLHCRRRAETNQACDTHAPANHFEDQHRQENVKNPLLRHSHCIAQRREENATERSRAKMSTSNDTIFNLISQLLNHSQYDHQMADLIEPERNAAFSVHLLIWVMSIVTYLLAIPVAVRMYRSRAYLNVVDYFSAHIVLCAFIAWIPAFILLLHQWFNVFTLRLCRLHYVLLSSNETVRRKRRPA